MSPSSSLFLEAQCLENIIGKNLSDEMSLIELQCILYSYMCKVHRNYWKEGQWGKKALWNPFNL